MRAPAYQPLALFSCKQFLGTIRDIHIGRCEMAIEIAQALIRLNMLLLEFLQLFTGHGDLLDEFLLEARERTDEVESLLLQLASSGAEERRAALAKAKQNYPKATTYIDWRKLNEDKTIDAVVVSTTDFTHAPCAVMAMLNGKHVYCEKPLTYSVYEARQVTEAAKKAGVVVGTPEIQSVEDGVSCLAEFAFNQNRLTKITSLARGIVKSVDELLDKLQNEAKVL